MTARDPSISYHTADNPPSDAFTDHAHPEDLIATAGNHFRNLYTHKCPTCGRPAMLTSYEVRTPSNPDPVTRHQVLCETTTNRYVKPGVDRCPPHDVTPAAPATAAPRNPMAKPVTHYER